MTKRDNEVVSLAPSKRSSLTGVGISVLIVAAITTSLHWRSANAAYPDRTPMLVATAPFTLQDSYSEEAAFLGRVAADKSSQLSFEIGGTLANVYVDEGQKVAAGAPLAVLENSSILARRDALSAQMKSTAAKLELAQLRLKRQKSLLTKGSVSRAEFDESRLEVQALEAQLDASRAQLASVKIDLNKSRLTAPYAGTVASKYVDEGTVVAPGTAIIHMLTADSLEATFGLGLSQSNALELGRSYSVLLRDQRLTATLLALRPDVDPVTRSAQAIFRLPTGTQALDGEPIKLLLRDQHQARGGWLPIAAMTESDRGLWSILRVETLDGRHRVLREAVEIIAIQGNRAYVTGTLPIKAQVVINGVNRLAPGSTVRLQDKNMEG